MEDMARLALIEQNVGDADQFNSLLFILLEYIDNILENPQEHEYRTIKTCVFEEFLNIEGVTDYLTYVGFQLGDETLHYPTSSSLNKLEIAVAAIDRKLDVTGACERLKSRINSRAPNTLCVKEAQSNYAPLSILTTNNQFLLRIQSLFNEVLKFEDEDLQWKAREVIPLCSLQLKAQERLREHQRQLKSEEIKEPEMSFDMALLIELVAWFKYSFFKWVDKPACESCGHQTVFERATNMSMDTEICRVELYKCESCGGSCLFPRYNNPGTLLRTRRGRCGEWATCFTLIARSLNYDTRYVYDVTDHVWNEIYDYERKEWIHVDPCEGKVNAPLMYEHGWGKKLSYVIGVSRDDVQDITWRYSSNHRAVLSRRDQVSESDLISTLLTLRAHRLQQCTVGRARHAALRTATELVALMVERKPSDYENEGRLSGSTEWRQKRGELGQSSHTFTIDKIGSHSIKYCTAIDKYTLGTGDETTSNIKGWDRGVFDSKNVFRKEERDWKMVYLAREDGTTTGSLSWRIAAADDFMLTSLIVAGSMMTYENGSVAWTIRFEDEEPAVLQLNDSPKQFDRAFKEVILKAEMTGGVSDVAWQHAQLFRQPLDSDTPAFEILVQAKKYK